MTSSFFDLFVFAIFTEARLIKLGQIINALRSLVLIEGTVELAISTNQLSL